MDERKPEQHTEPDGEKRPEALEDLDVPETENEDVKGGVDPIAHYSFKQGWPTKYGG